MNSNLSQTDKKALVDFHFKSLQGMYFSEYISGKGYVLLFSDLVEDSYYNYIAQSKRNIQDVIRETRPFFVDRGRRVAIYVTPCSDLYGNEKDLPKNFELFAADAWMVLNDDQILRSYSAAMNIQIEPVSYESRDEYTKVFHLSYAGDNPDDPYANLPEYYSKSLNRSFDYKVDPYLKEYFWAKMDGQPVGVVSMLSDRRIAGVYGLGTLEAYRKHGVGTSLMAFLVKRAQVLKIPTMMCQTEAGSKVEQWYIRMGFQTLFTAKYYVESSKDEGIH